ncbi:MULTISPECIES: hypothetical protein [unclassified Mycobacterium]|jgi:hypothetical protein|uniref:hypothetical protein n=1 Tax=unclassified Mycobacterium TaxID=2642494 RepID=UPI0007FEA59C|nr:MULTISPECIES: hypothetical protein [unclassified Mycobacterium]OBG89902.1 hypothetical protein A5698_22795 [Mycobacterium sp. E136]OBK82182.1 hypothetical protein A5650_23600 [Mycobacterium sp. 1164985.4]
MTELRNLTQPTDDQIDAALLEALSDAGGEGLHPWAVIRRRLPGSHDRKGERLIALWDKGRVYVIKVRGRNYVGLGDADDMRLAAAKRARVPRVL